MMEERYLLADKIVQLLLKGENDDNRKYTKQLWKDILDLLEQYKLELSKLSNDKNKQ